MIEYRAATVADLPSLVRIIEQLDKQHQDYGRASQVNTNVQLLEYALINGQYNPVAVDPFMEGTDQYLIGWSGYAVIPGLGDGEVLAIGTYVSPGYRGNGISRKLRELGINYYKGQGYKVLTGSVYIDNKEGLAAALSIGYKQTGYIIQYTL